VSPVAEIGDQPQLLGIDLGDQPGDATDFRLFQGEVGEREGRRHGDAELDRVGDEHAPQAGHGCEEHRDHAHQQQRLLHGPAKHDVGDLRRSEVYRRHDHAVEEQAEVDRAEAADERRGFPRVAHLVELKIGQHV